MTTTYQVTGMTCEHCSRAVSAELSELAGVRGVSVSLVPGGTSAVTVTSDSPLAADVVAAALDEAGGYRLPAGPRPGPAGPGPGPVPGPAPAGPEAAGPGAAAGPGEQPARFLPVV